MAKRQSDKSFSSSSSDEESETDFDQVRESPSLDLFVHGVAALAAKTVPREDQREQHHALIKVLRAYGAPRPRNFDMLMRQVGSWRVDNAADLQEHNATIVQLSNWLVSVDTELPQRTFIDKSLLGSQAGYGLFAARVLPISEEDRYIAPYGGERYASEADYQQQTGHTLEEATSEYIIVSPEHGIVDGEYGFHLDEQGRWANTQRTRAECNAEFRWTKGGGEIWLWVMEGKRIAKGAEIYVWYSEEFAAHLYGGGEKRVRTGQEDVMIEALGRMHIK